MSIKQIQTDYLNLNMSGSYTGISSLMKAQHYKDKSKVKEAVQQIDAYTLNKRVRKQFLRRRTKVFFPYQQIGMYLLKIRRLKSKNSPYT
jgi:hypothetical protein